MEYFNLNRLRHFYTIAQLESYTKASQKLHIQQPALSKTIKALEEDLGLKLFQKEGRNIRLTRDGARVFEKCEHIFEHVEALSNLTKEKEVLLNKTLHIVSDDSIASHLLPKVLKDLNFKERALRPVITTGKSKQLMEDLVSKKAEIGFFFYTPKINSNLKVIKKIEVPFKLVISKKNEKDKSKIFSFIGSREVNDNSNNRFPTIKRMQKIWPETKSVLSSNSLLIHKEFVIQGLGVSILPEFLISKEIQNKTLINLMPQEEFIFEMKIIIHVENENSDLLKNLSDKVRESFINL
jgi:DNA-binding transcriptional LysR family regulator